jgi:hypothetical protein
MSYCLCFWRYKNDIASNDHAAVDVCLSNGDYVEKIERISVEKILENVNAKFSLLGWTQPEGESTSLFWEHIDKDKGVFQVYITTQVFRVDCYGMCTEDMNHIIDIASSFSLSLYDPQTGKKYVCAVS